MSDYQTFLSSKVVRAKPSGFEPTLPMNPHLFDWQSLVTKWAIRQGKAALWVDCGGGKTLMSLEWSRHVHEHAKATGERWADVLILTPLAVAKQFVREGAKFGIPVTLCRDQDDVMPGINVTNYERLAKFDASTFAGVVIDESDVLANYTGQTKRMIVKAFEHTPYKLDCSATPAPNDHLELGNHADFLGVMESHEMISRWFLNDASEAGKYSLKKHAEKDFWRWVSGWAACVGKPSDLGYANEGFDLPPLEIVDHCVDADHSEGREDGFLFRMPSLSATTLHEEKRRTCEARAAKVAAIVATKPDVPWLVWCDTDYEADELLKVLPADTVEVRGSHSPESKEQRLEDFATGKIRVLLLKPKIGAHGLNYQHCRNVAYTGLGYSFKQYYQSLRRCWRYGQTQPVTAHIVSAETEGRIGEVIRRKQADHDAMKRAMVEAVGEYGLGSEKRRSLSDYNPTVPMTLPSWLTGSVSC